MRTEKRFELKYYHNTPYLADNQKGIEDNLTKETSHRKLVDLLNKQQAIISALKKENKDLKVELEKGFDIPIPYVENSLRRIRAEKIVDELREEIKELEEDNERLKQRIRDLNNGVGFDD